MSKHVLKFCFSYTRFNPVVSAYYFFSSQHQDIPSYSPLLKVARNHTLGKMVLPYNYSNKGSLKEAYENANPATNIVIERSRLKLLRTSLKLKRPIHSLRADSGLPGLRTPTRRRLYQKWETEAVYEAIAEKNHSINNLKQELRTQPLELQQVNSNLISHHNWKMKKKTQFLRQCDNTKFRDWPQKNTKLVHLNLRFH